MKYILRFFKLIVWVLLKALVLPVAMLLSVTVGIILIFCPSFIYYYLASGDPEVSEIKASTTHEGLVNWLCDKWVEINKIID